MSETKQSREELPSFVPKHLNSEETQSFYQRALAQAEANLANAWANYVMAAAALLALQKDRERVSDG